MLISIYKKKQIQKNTIYAFEQNKKGMKITMKEYNNEKEFLENYDITKFDRLSMTSDILLISVSSKDSINYRKTSTKMISILLVKRDDFPFKGKW